MEWRLVCIQNLACKVWSAAMAEWLRRLTRNQMGSSRVGSNPTRSDTWVCWRSDSFQKTCRLWCQNEKSTVRSHYKCTCCLSSKNWLLPPKNQWIGGVGIRASTLNASRDSSVGRASDWRSEGPWFNPGSRQAWDALLKIVRHCWISW